MATVDTLPKASMVEPKVNCDSRQAIKMYLFASEEGSASKAFPKADTIVKEIVLGEMAEIALDVGVEAKPLMGMDLPDAHPDL